MAKSSRLNGGNHIFEHNMMFFDHIVQKKHDLRIQAESSGCRICSVNRVFENYIRVFRSREYHRKIRHDLLYLLHLSDREKVHYASSYGYFIENWISVLFAGIPCYELRPCPFPTQILGQNYPNGVMGVTRGMVLRVVIGG